MASSLAARDGLWALGFAALAALFAYHPIFSNDGLWQLALGRVIHETGAIPRADLFSAVHPERPWVQFQWLWEWLAFLLEQRVGLGGLRVVQALLMAASLALTYLVSRWVTGRTAAAAAVSGLVLLLYADRFRLRPDALNLLFTFALLPLWLQRDRTQGGREAAGGPAVHGRAPLGVRRAALLFVLCALWSNLHAGASLLALASAGAVVVGRAVDPRGGPVERLAQAQPTLLGVTLLGLFASPIFLPGLLFFAGVYRFMVDTGNAEWAPPWSLFLREPDLANAAIAAAPSAVALLYGSERVRAYRREGRAALDTGELLLCGGYLLLAHHALRNVVLCSVPFALWAGRFAASGSRSRRGWLLVAFALACGALSVRRHLLQAYGSLAEFRELVRYDLAPGAFPEQTVDWMLAQNIQGDVLNHGQWAGYLIWRLSPHGHGVFIDTRYNVTPQMYALFRETNNPFTRPRAMQEAFARHGIELALFPEPVLPLDAEGPWRLLYRAGEQALYQHVDGPHAAANLARRDAWLEQVAPGHRDEVERAVVQAGGRRWLKAPYQRFRLSRDEAAGTAQALRRAAGLHYRAGDCQRAVELWRAAAEEAPLSPTSRVRWADCLYSAGAREQGDRALRGVDPRTLPLEERFRASWWR